MSLQSHLPHCRVKEFHPPYWKLFLPYFIFCFLNVVWALASGGFRTVFDTFVYYELVKLADAVKLTLVTGFVALLTTQVTCEEFSQCYSDVNICLWTDGSSLTQSAAQTACQQRNGYFLPRVTNSNIQSKLQQFHNAAWNLLGGQGFWIDVTAVAPDSFHWIDDSQLSG